MSLETNEVSVIISDKKQNNDVKDDVETNLDKNNEIITNNIQTTTKMEEEESTLQPSPDSTSQLTTATTTQTTPTINTKQQTRVVPLVFVQAQSNMKVPTSIQSGNNTMQSQQIIVNANSQFMTTLNSKLNITKANTTIAPVVLTQTSTNTKSPQIILQKSGTNSSGQTLIPVSVNTPSGTKQTFAYLGAIIKPQGSKPGENQIMVPTNHLPAGLVPAPTNQKLVLAPMAMPKLSTTRFPITCPTSSSNHPKLANIFLPMSINSQMKSNTQSVINFKISNGQIQSDPKGSITVLCESNKKNNENNNDVTSTTVEKKEEKIMKPITEVVINSSIANNPPKCNKNSEKNDKTYELSIPDEPNNKCGLNYTIKYNDDMKSFKIEQNGQEVDTIKTDIEKTSPQPSVIVPPKQETIHRKPLHEVSILKKCNLNSYDRKIESKNKFLRKSPETKITVTTEPAENPTNKVSTSQEVRKVNTERRRKSQYTYLRDFDEVVVTSGNAWEDKQKGIKSEKNMLHKKTEKTYKNKAVDSTIDKFSKHFPNSEITFTKLNSPEDEYVHQEVESKKSVEDFVEIEVIKQEIPQLCMDIDKDIRTALDWKDGIGTLPGSKLKFHINEFGFTQVLVTEDYEKLIELKNNLNDIKKEEDIGENDLLNCAECGCYGMPSEFVSRRYCSTQCKDVALQTYEKLKREVFLKESKAKKKKKKLGLISKHEIKTEPQIKQEETSNQMSQISNSDEDNTSNDASQNSHINYPWQGGKKGFSWAKYLDHVKAKAAPLKLFKDPFPYAKNGFRVGMKLEGIDPQHPSYFCAMTVAEVQGYRIRLHFDGYSDSYDFWVNADSMDIFPCGWCEKYNHTLHPPPGYSEGEFNWTTYLKHSKASAAPRHLFANRAGNAICPNGFRLGMKFEAVDKKNSSLVCVATVADLMDNRFLVHFDSWDDIYDYWADPSSPYIHPVGWCDKYGHSLTPPNDFPNPDTFTWEKYLKETKSVAAPVRAFKQRPATGFKRGMRIECVDKRVPQLIRVATVDDVKDHQIRVAFDGWPDKYSYWVDDDSSDIHPPGWCQKTGHQIESPLTPQDLYYNFEDCPTIGCRGIGHILGAVYETHNNGKDCPYSDENLSDPPVLPDRLRLLDNDIKTEAVVPVSREPRKENKQKNMCKAPKIRRLTETEIKQEWPEEDSSDSMTRKRKLINRERRDSVSDSKFKVSNDILFKTLSNNTEYTPPTQQALAKHSKYLNEIISYNNRDPRLWSEEDVMEFVSSLPSCKENCSVFQREKIDGEAFLMLTQNDLVDILKFKLGPAIKLYNSILLLRQNVNSYNN